jgi:hypothetical protein
MEGKKRIGENKEGTDGGGTVSYKDRKQRGKKLAIRKTARMETKTKRKQQIMRSKEKKNKGEGE